MQTEAGGIVLLRGATILTDRTDERMSNGGRHLDRENSRLWPIRFPLGLHLGGFVFPTNGRADQTGAIMEAMSALVSVSCKAVLFDMDGTLVDSTHVVELAWSRWAARHDFPLRTVLAFSHGRPTIATMEHFLPGRDHTEELKEMDRQEELQLEGIVAVPGAGQVVHALRNHPWAIVTSAWRTLAEARITAAGLPLPNVIVPIDEIRNGKPHPEGFLRAAERLGVAPEECLAFEDTRPGIESALNAGMQVVGLLTTVAAEQLRHRPLIRDFRDVTIQFDGERLQVELRHQTPGPRAASMPEI